MYVLIFCHTANRPPEIKRTLSTVWWSACWHPQLWKAQCAALNFNFPFAICAQTNSRFLCHRSKRLLSEQGVCLLTFFQTFVEAIYLNNEEVLGLQTREDHHIFQWLKFQASRGTTEAEVNMSFFLSFFFLAACPWQILGEVFFWGHYRIEMSIIRLPFYTSPHMQTVGAQSKRANRSHLCA